MGKDTKHRITHWTLKAVGYPFFLVGAVVSKFHVLTGYILIGIMLTLWIVAGAVETIEILKQQESDA